MSPSRWERTVSGCVCPAPCCEQDGHCVLSLTSVVSQPRRRLPCTGLLSCESASSISLAGSLLQQGLSWTWGTCLRGHFFFLSGLARHVDGWPEGMGLPGSFTSSPVLANGGSQRSPERSPTSFLRLSFPACQILPGACPGQALVQCGAARGSQAARNPCPRGCFAGGRQARMETGQDGERK